MKRIALAAVVLVLAGCSAGPRPGDRPLAPNPSAYITAELAFARLAQEKGQWTAFRETATKDAQMFVPNRVLAAEFLKGRANPEQSVRWQPHAVFSSCDGSAGVTTGAWQAPVGSGGYYTTVWTRSPDGEHRWLLDSVVPQVGQRPAPEFIRSREAACGTKPVVALYAPAEGADMKVGLSRDQTLSWTSVVQPDGSRTVTVRMWDGTAMQTVIDDKVSAAEANAK